MNVEDLTTDAGHILAWLRGQKVGRHPATIARWANIPRWRVERALDLLISFHKVDRESNGTVRAR